MGRLNIIPESSAGGLCRSCTRKTEVIAKDRGTIYMQCDTMKGLKLGDEVLQCDFYSPKQAKLENHHQAWIISGITPDGTPIFMVPHPAGIGHYPYKPEQLRGVGEVEEEEEGVEHPETDPDIITH